MASIGLEQLCKKFSEEVNKYNNLQKDYQKICNVRQQLDEQLNENNIVKQELDLLEDTAVVHKLIGPALIKQDLKEAKDTVNNRIKYISGEIKKQEDQLKGIEKSQLEQKDIINKIQQQIKTAQMKAAKA